MVWSDDGSIDDEDIYNLVKEANKSRVLVHSEDILSDKVQWCSADGEIMIGLRKVREMKG